jgi:uncharacterized protein YraI
MLKRRRDLQRTDRSLGFVGRRAAALLAFGMIALGATTARAEPTSLPTYVSTPEGWMHAEDRYLPGVAHAELGWFAGQTRRGQRTECVKAQAIAARTFVLQYLNRRSHTRTLPSMSGSFQAWTSRYSGASKRAAQATRGQVLMHDGVVIYANYASGAFPLDADGFPFAPPRYGYPSSFTWQYIRDQYDARQAGRISRSTWRSRVTRHGGVHWTYILNTDNEGRSGSAVIATPHARAGQRNRGGLGQYRSWWLDLNRGYDHTQILRAFYGEDVTIFGAGGGGSSTTAATGAAPATASGAAYEVTASELNVRSSPSDRSSRVGSVLRGQRYVAKEHANGWVRIDLRAGVSGWCSAAHLRAVSGVSGVEITAGALNVRTGPGTGYTDIGGVRRGQRFVVLEEQSGWVRIDWNGRSAWCSATYTSRVSL